MILLMSNCASSSLAKENNAKLTASALYSPPMITLQPGVVYQFKEGTLTGTGQVFHSDFSWRQALIIGNGK